MIVSIFNDVVGPVMRGPSSSHCAAALRIGRLARDLVDEKIEHVLVEFDDLGSLPATHTSQGSDMGLFGGLLGWDAADDRLPESNEALRDAGIDLKFVYGNYGDQHPNTYRLTISNDSESIPIIGISTGGGMIEVIEIDSFALSIHGDYHETLIWSTATPSDEELETARQITGADFVVGLSRNSQTLVQLKSSEEIDDDSLNQAFSNIEFARVRRLRPVLPVQSRKTTTVPFQSCNELLAIDGVDNEPIWKWAVRYEMARGGLSEKDVIEKMIDIVRVLRKSIDEGLRGTHYEDRVLGFQSGNFQRAMENNRLLDSGALNKIVLYTTALMEVKSSMGVIVAAPTAGACAAMPATCLAIGETLQLSDEEIAKAMLAAGLIGVFIATAWSFAAEVGGCQAEGGSASAMSAAALVCMSGGTTSQATSAASMSLQNMLGLICDPVANRVEVPCLGKNVMAASNAISCANMSLAGFDCVIPLDETIDAARRVSERMPREHRCTALGGLAMTPTSQKIAERLAQCSSGCCSVNAAKSTSLPTV